MMIEKEERKKTVKIALDKNKTSPRKFDCLYRRDIKTAIRISVKDYHTICLEVRKLISTGIK